MSKLTLTFAIACGLIFGSGAVAADKQKDKYDKAGDKTESALDKTGSGAKKGMRAAGEGVEEGLEATGDGVGAAVEHTSRGVATAGKKTGQGLEKAGDAIADFFGDNDPENEDDRASRVMEAQRKLQKKGYYQGPLDGIPGSETASALRQFQQDKDLPATGQLDYRTSKKLGL